MTATLILKSLFFQNENSFFEKIIIDKNEYEYSLEKEIQIKFNEIESEIGIKTVNTKIVFRDKYEDHFFEIMKGTKIYGYLDVGKAIDMMIAQNIYLSMFGANALKLKHTGLQRTKMLLHN